MDGLRKMATAMRLGRCGSGFVDLEIIGMLGLSVWGVVFLCSLGAWNGCKE